MYASQAMLHFFVTLSICINFVCVAMVTFVTVWGGGKALRGKDGSMDYAVDEMCMSFELNPPAYLS